MARQPQSGLPFLIRRSDSGQFSYWRILSDEIVPHFHGEINLEWSASTREMASPEIIKISLKTGDDKTARSRWGSIHAQVEAMLEQALGCIREKALDAEARKRLKKSDGLSGNEIATIAGQARHDVLAADDRAWEGPEEMTPMAQIMAKILKQNNTGRADADARAVLASQIVEQRMVKASLKSRELGLLDRDLTVQHVDTGKHMASKAAIIESELTQRLQENGIELPEDSQSRRRLGQIE